MASGYDETGLMTTGSNNIALGYVAAVSDHRQQQHRHRQRGAGRRGEHDSHRHPGHADRHLYRRHHRQSVMESAVVVSSTGLLGS